MRYKVNLLPPVEKTFFDQIIYFSYHYLRYILVITQLVVIGVFMFRFTVDQDIVELKDTLTQKEEIVTVSKPLLAEVDRVQGKITNINKLVASQTTFQGMLDYVLSRFPSSITTNRMTITEDTIDFEGETDQVTTINLFYNKLQQEKRFKTITISNLKKTETGFTFDFVLQGFIVQS